MVVRLVLVLISRCSLILVAASALRIRPMCQIIDFIREAGIGETSSRSIAPTPDDQSTKQSLRRRTHRRLVLFFHVQVRGKWPWCGCGCQCGCGWWVGSVAPSKTARQGQQRKVEQAAAVVV
ncbi:hypothetical protein BDZ97DRAFT_1828925, partial [Flammula alnicola]